MSVDFDTPANRIIEQFAGKKESEFRIPADLPDIAFLRRLSIQGRLRYFQGSGTATITITPNTGETLFVYRVIISAADASATTFTGINDGNTRFTVQTGTTTTGLAPFTIDFIDSLVGNSVKTFTITANRVTALASVFAWIENTSRIRDTAI